MPSKRLKEGTLLCRLFGHRWGEAFAEVNWWQCSRCDADQLAYARQQEIQPSWDWLKTRPDNAALDCEQEELLMQIDGWMRKLRKARSELHNVERAIQYHPAAAYASVADGMIEDVITEMEADDAE